MAAYPLQPVARGLPRRLQIPRLGLDAAVEYIGVTASGAMDTPKDPADVGWFNAGPRPGEPGSAVIDGHLDRKDGSAAVFDNLFKLQPGDTIMILDENSISLSFTVRESRMYDREADTAAIFSSATGSHLNLITCAGSWDTAQKSYTERLVVFADASL